MATSMSAIGTTFSDAFMPVCERTNFPGPLNQPHFLIVGPSLRPDEGLLMLLPFFLRRAISDTRLGVCLVDCVPHVKLADGRGAGVGRYVGVNSVGAIDNKIRGVRASAAGVGAH